jgi:hypothetical protein
MYTKPLLPVRPALAVLSSRLPLLETDEDPLRRIVEPPRALSVVSPAARRRSTPLPEPPVPKTKLMEPAWPAAASPVTKSRAPVFPVLEVPVRSVAAPLAPWSPAFAVWMDTGPLVPPSL